MKNNDYLMKLYNLSKNSIDSLISNKNFTEEEILIIIKSLSLGGNFLIFEKNNYNMDQISKLFKFYEEELKSSFIDDKTAFEMKFKCYLLLIELFTGLCTLFSYKKEKRVLINEIFQILKESNNMLKLFIPFDKKDIKILNNLIGQQLYYYTHIQYIKTKDKEINYILQEYLLNLERILHGYELSFDSEFGEDNHTKQEAEEMIFINNSSFLLLKMIHKLDFYMPNTKYVENPYFIKIINFFKEISKLNINSHITTLEVFEESLLEEFSNSAKYLEKNKSYYMFDEKIKLLQLNTDEYKQLIDIILSLKQ